MGNPIVNALKNAASALNPAAAAEKILGATGVSGAASSAAKSAANAAGNATGLGAVGTDISSVAGFTSALGNKSLWIRVAKVTVGGALLLVGVAHLTGADGKVARTAIKYAPLM